MTATTTQAVEPPVAAARSGRFDVGRLFSRWGTIVALVLLIAYFSATEGSAFASSNNFLNVLNQVSILGIIAAGLTVCLVMGLFDLSIGAVATLGGYLATRWATGTETSAGVVAVLLAAAAVAVCIGLVNGIVVSYLGVSAFIGTLAMGAILGGVALGYSDRQTITSGIPVAFLDIGQSKVGPVPTPVFITAAVVGLLWLFLERTQMGRHLYAIGGNSEAARLAGVRVKQYALLALTISALCAALGGIVAMANIGAGQPHSVGDVYLLDAFAAAFIGASTLRSGKFHIIGTVVGVLLLGVINNGLSIAGAETYWQSITKGVILILAVFMSGVVSVRRLRQ